MLLRLPQVCLLWRWRCGGGRHRYARADASSCKCCTTSPAVACHILRRCAGTGAAALRQRHEHCAAFPLQLLESNDLRSVQVYHWGRGAAAGGGVANIRAALILLRFAASFPVRCLLCTCTASATTESAARRRAAAA